MQNAAHIALSVLEQTALSHILAGSRKTIIAAALSLAVTEVNPLCHRIFDKLGVRTEGELGAVACAMAVAPLHHSLNQAYEALAVIAAKSGAQSEIGREAVQVMSQIDDSRSHFQAQMRAYGLSRLVEGKMFGPQG